MNADCFGVEFERMGKRWAWCCLDGHIHEISTSLPKCGICGRRWRPVAPTAAELERIKPDIEQFIEFPFYRKRAQDLEAQLRALTEAAQWAVRGMRMLAEKEAEQRGTSPDETEYTFLKALRRALGDVHPGMVIPPEALAILHAFKRGTPPSHRFCECQKCVALYDACRAYPVYEVPV